MSAGPRVCRAWVSCYTRALPTDVAQRRREEIESDLFEHAVDAQANGIRESSFTIEVFGRVLSGMPADLSWRRAVRKEPLTRFVIGGSTMESPRPRLDMAYMLMLVVDIAIVIAILPAWGVGANGLTFVMWSLPTIGLLVVALLTRFNMPMLSLACATLGSIAAALHYYWLPPAYLFPIATIILGVMATRRPRPVAV